MTKNILIVGVGGQGTLLTGRIIGGYALREEYDVKMSEVHGMAQRGGSVVMQVKYADKVYSPLIELGEADVILAFEKLEALRYMPFLKQGGTVICNTEEIDPMPVVMGRVSYPLGIEEKLKQMCKQTYFIDALTIAQEIGEVKVVNMVMIGAYVAYIGENIEKWEKIIEGIVPMHTLKMNKEALKRGYEAYLNN